MIISHSSYKTFCIKGLDFEDLIEKQLKLEVDVLFLKQTSQHPCDKLR